MPSARTSPRKRTSGSRGFLLEQTLPILRWRIFSLFRHRILREACKQLECTSDVVRFLAQDQSSLTAARAFWFARLYTRYVQYSLKASTYRRTKSFLQIRQIRRVLFP